MTRQALMAAGCIQPKSAEVINRRANKLKAVGATAEAEHASTLAAEELAMQQKSRSGK